VVAELKVLSEQMLVVDDASLIGRGWRISEFNPTPYEALSAQPISTVNTARIGEEALVV